MISITTYADGFGNWHATVTSTDSLSTKGARKMAKIAITEEISIREGNRKMKVKIRDTKVSVIPGYNGFIATPQVNTWEFSEAAK